MTKEEISARQQQAAQFHAMGYNCAQSARECIARFLEKNQSVVCRDLKGVETGNVLRACPDCISDAVEIIGEVLF